MLVLEMNAYHYVRRQILLKCFPQNRKAIELLKCLPISLYHYQLLVTWFIPVQCIRVCYAVLHKTNYVPVGLKDVKTKRVKIKSEIPQDSNKKLKSRTHLLFVKSQVHVFRTRLCCKNLAVSPLPSQTCSDVRIRDAFIQS